MNGSVTVAVGLVGHGRWGRVLARNIRQHAQLRLAGICHRSAPPGRGFYRSLDELLTLQAVQAVVIASPLPSRAALIERALLAGKHVFAEKPLAGSLEQAEALVATARSHGLCLFTNYVHAYANGVDYALDALERLGPARMIEARFLQPGPMYRTENAMSLLGSHALAIVMRMTGAPSAQAGWHSTEYREFAHGLSATLTGNLHEGRTQARVSVHIGHPVRSRVIDLVTDTATLSVSLADPSGVTESRYPARLQADNLLPEIRRVEFDEQNNLHRILGRFVAAIQGEQPDNAALALAVQRVLDPCLKDNRA